MVDTMLSTNANCAIDKRSPIEKHNRLGGGYPGGNARGNQVALWADEWHLSILKKSIKKPPFRAFLEERGQRVGRL